jgi:hypothetical protein
MPKMNISAVITNGYENNRLSRRGENKPNSNPIQTQTNPISKVKIAGEFKMNHCRFCYNIFCKSTKIGGVVRGLTRFAAQVAAFYLAAHRTKRNTVLGFYFGLLAAIAA